jgi:glucose-1-phosphate cytidylyltransferase
MVEIGEHPILWHIMKHYAHFGFYDIFVALGYKGEVIKRYCLDYHAMCSNMRIDLCNGHVDMFGATPERWNINLIETGALTNTGGRVKRLQPWLGDDTFMLTYGDGVSTVDINKLLDFHKSHGRIATLTAVRPPARFGALDMDGPMVKTFAEKSQAHAGWISGGFFVLEPAVFDYIDGDETSFESVTLRRLAMEGELAAYRHDGFWQCMDTLRDKHYLESLWEEGTAPWRLW